MHVKANISFDGQAESAIRFYSSVLNAEVKYLVRFADFPQEAGAETISEDMLLFLEHKYHFGYAGSKKYEGFTEVTYRVFDREHFLRWHRSVADIAPITTDKYRG